MCRFFIFSDSQKSLFYFKSPDDVPKPNGLRGQISVFECVVEDLDEKGNPRGGSGQDIVELKKGETASLLLRIRHKVRNWTLALTKLLRCGLGFWGNCKEMAGTMSASVLMTTVLACQIDSTSILKCLCLNSHLFSYCEPQFTEQRMYRLCMSQS